MSLKEAFDELHFGPERTLNLRAERPTGQQAVARAEAWLRERQVAKAGEVLVITGRGSGSEDGVPVVREAIVRLLASLRRRNVVAEVREHTAGSFVVRLAPVRALFEAPRRRREPAPAAVADPDALTGLADETRALLRLLAAHALDALGVHPAGRVRGTNERFLQDEMVRQFAALSVAIPAGPDRELQLRAAARRALEEYEEL
jgi:hypothetical protein